MTETFDQLDLDISDLTIAEIVIVEDLTGMPLDALGQPDKPKGKMMQALAYIVKRREDPDFTYEQAGEIRMTTTSSKPDPTVGDE
tara:strand:+ start:2859 stop:3113 length:255 start_codon:yes stop_codon:yes gene_type:complete